MRNKNQVILRILLRTEHLTCGAATWAEQATSEPLQNAGLEEKANTLGYIKVGRGDLSLKE